jgi:hypothetical protein
LSNTSKRVPSIRPRPATKANSPRQPSSKPPRDPARDYNPPLPEDLCYAAPRQTRALHSHFTNAILTTAKFGLRESGQGRKTTEQDELHVLMFMYRQSPCVDSIHRNQCLCTYHGTIKVITCANQRSPSLQTSSPNDIPVLLPNTKQNRQKSRRKQASSYYRQYSPTR